MKRALSDLVSSMACSGKTIPAWTSFHAFNSRQVPCTFEFKQEAVRLVDNGHSIAAAARTLGVVDQTLFNWVKAHKQGKLT